MNFKLKIWRQKGRDRTGRFEHYTIDNILPEMSFLEMLDLLNDDLIQRGQEAVEFDSDCREGICGTCGLVIDGMAHGSKVLATTCELRMREFSDGATITVEPFRAEAFPVIKDLVVDRGAFDRIIAAGGYITVNTGSAPEANALPIPKAIVEEAMDSSVCIGCGACTAACPVASASLFVGAKVMHLSLLPQGQPEKADRVAGMVKQMDKEGFGNCSNHGECEAACPKGISISNIAGMRREYMKAAVGSR